MKPIDSGAPLLPDDFGFHVRLVQMWVVREFQRAFDGTGVTPGMHTALVIIRDNPGIRPGALAEPLMVNPTNITLLLGKMAEAGLISRRIDKSDRRALRLHLTALGKQLLDRMQARLDTLEAKLLDDVEARGPGGVRRSVERILERIAEPKPPAGLRSSSLPRRRPADRGAPAARRTAVEPRQP